MSEQMEIDDSVMVDREAAHTVEPDPPLPAPEVIPEMRPIVDGERSQGTGPTLDVVDPATGQIFARVACAGPDEIDQAAEAAARSAALWRSTPFEDRGAALRRLAKLIYEQRFEIAELIAREQGKPTVEALTLEILPALDHLRFITHRAERYHGGLAVDPRHPFYAHKRAHYMYDALGVVAIVTPSPLPFAIPLVQTAAALAMGNAVLLKPSPRTPLCGLRLGELAEQADFPAGVVNVVPAVPEDTLRLVTHPKVDKVFVTGGLEAGQHVMAAAGCTPLPVVLCLGGKHPSIVAGDADVEFAARGVVWGALANCGQNCGSIERVYVEERIASKFLDRVLAEVDKLIVGEPLDEGTDVGPMGSADRRNSVHRQVTEAILNGAKLLRGGKIPDGPGFFYPPTVLLEPPHDCALLQEETLGPVIPIVIVESLERALLLANDSKYALSASGWTKSNEHAGRMMQGLQAGVVTINDVLYAFGEPAATWSGYRRSGIGQNHGTPGIREMSRQRFVSFDPQPGEAPVFAYPYDADTAVMAKSSVEFLHADGWFQRFGAIVRLWRSKRFRKRLSARRVLLAKKHQVK
jgi:succinate-semialdehyde dehydrogenase/glutarate-semialdehyde dehydrogenase